jgi:uncharacterized membrane protein
LAAGDPVPGDRVRRGAAADRVRADRHLQLRARRLGIGPEAAMLVLLASLAGSVINIPVARLRGNVTQLRQMVTFDGVFITGIVAVLLAAIF